MPRARSSKHAYLKPKQSTGVRFACFELVAQALTDFLFDVSTFQSCSIARAENAKALASFDAAPSQPSRPKSDLETFSARVSKSQ